MEGMSSAFKKVMESEEENKKNYKHRPPDGGWGWVIVISFAVQNMILLPILINFGLMFREVFAQLNMTTTDSSIIININSAAGLLIGLMNGPILKTFGFRKTACVGAMLTFFGNSMTSFAMSSFDFILYYGIISSIGVNLVMSSFSLALNTYFLERRGIATGIAMSATGLGPIFMPLLISKLMTIYGGRGTALIMASLTLHSFVGALLLHPVKWHYRKAEDGSDKNGDIEICNKKDHLKSLNEEDQIRLDPIIINGHLIQRRFSDTTPFRSVPEKSRSLHSLNILLDASKLSTNSVVNVNICNAVNKQSDDPNKETDKMKVKCQLYEANKSDESETTAFIENNENNYHEKITIEKESREDEAVKKGWKSRVVQFFDLDLLQEPIFRNIWIGLTIVKSDVLSILVFIGIGIGRGFLSVYRALVVPNHVPLEKLPSASGLQAVLNGICLLSFGPVLGFVKDKVGNYDWYIYILNCLTLITVTLWITEFIIRACRHKNRSN
ncbi:uncharacterized protein LOC142328734 isoform X3 [Lycorma delicatula]|uniref:uncharacterized protein LOC142328734 isoform X3 n=1 Tax=Lycorma delicatula TaxID=130591 RepID=UPI003F5169BB